MKKIFTCLLICITMILTILPMDSQASEVTVDSLYKVYPTIMVISDYNAAIIYTKDPIKNVDNTFKQLSYNESTNTLTIKDYKADVSIYASAMGNDFKIKLVGSNDLASLRVSGNTKGGSLTITGSGSLVLNKNKYSPFAIYLLGDMSKGDLHIENGVNVSMYTYSDADEDYNIIYSTYTTTEKASSAFKFDGKLTTTPKYSTTSENYTRYKDVYAFPLEDEVRYVVDRFKKAGESNEYVGVVLEDEDGIDTGTYNMYTLYKDSEYGYLAKPVSGQADVEPGKLGYTDMKEELENVLLLDEDEVYSFTLCTKSNDTNVYGIAIFNDVYENLSYYLYRLIKDDNYGLLAKRVDNNSYTSIPTEYVPCVLTTAKVYHHTIDTDSLIIKHTTNHIYKTTITKATTTKDGKKTVKCSSCGDMKTTAIPKIASTKLSTTSYTYDGKVKKPSVVVKDSNNKTISASNYTVSYVSGRKNVGKYSVKITFKSSSNYSGTITKYFTINPPKTSISRLSKGRKSFTAKWSKKTTQVTGYQLQYSTSSKFSKATTKTITISSNKTTAKQVAKLLAKKKYYVRVRTYKTVKSAKYYSGYSAVKNVTTR